MPELDSTYMRTQACRATPTPWLCLPDELMLTHHTFRSDKYIEAPRYDREREISLLTGKLSVEQASRYRRRVTTARALELASVRHVSAGKLRVEGFAVVHTPGRFIGKCGVDLQHVSIVWPNDDPVNRQDIPWPQAVSERFVQCFNGYQ
ncbi:hypothetical protein ACLQ2R_00920 [Streptosporangium sp. DT93]|uniref:hypothetical protein n=1 Tax=Streptosporangium sp. DT93 TaxID=3393428 RepID=UPI003CF8F263